MREMVAREHPWLRRRDLDLSFLGDNDSSPVQEEEVGPERLRQVWDTANFKLEEILLLASFKGITRGHFESLVPGRDLDSPKGGKVGKCWEVKSQVLYFISRGIQCTF